MLWWWQGVCELRYDDGAPLRRPRVGTWALAATSAPSLLGWTSSDTGSPSASGAKQHKSRRFCLPRTRGAGFVAWRGWLWPKRAGGASCSACTAWAAWRLGGASRYCSPPRLRKLLRPSDETTYTYAFCNAVADAATDDN